MILDISDMSKPKLRSRLDWSPPFAWPTHSLVPIDLPIAGHRWMLVADEHVQPLDPAMSPELPAMLWMVDITDETRPIPVSTFQLPELVGTRSPLMTACHQPVETITGTEVPAAWFASGLRVIDIANPLAMREARVVHAGRAAGRATRVQQRRVRRSARADLSDRPQPWPVDSRADLACSAGPAIRRGVVQRAEPFLGATDQSIAAAVMPHADRPRRLATARTR